MKDAIIMNEVQNIQKVLKEFLGNRKAVKVAVKISTVLQEETQHTHNGEIFFVHKDKSEKLVLTMESEIMKKVQAILNSYLEEDEARECIEQLMAEKKATDFETIKIPGSNDPIYAELIKHNPANYAESVFINNLKMAINKPIKKFEVFVNNPLIDNGKIQFVSGINPSVGYSYNEWEKLAKENDLLLGTIDEFILFLGWLINSLVEEKGWFVPASWEAVCTNSQKLERYCLGNTYKILAYDRVNGGFWVACACNKDGNGSALANFSLCSFCDTRLFHGVGWFVRRV